MKYTEYLKSTHWKELREQKIKTHRKCFMCHSELNLAVHHMRYDSLGKEVDDDTVLLCNKCHYKVHFTGKKFRKQLKKKHKRMIRFKSGIGVPQYVRNSYLTDKEREEFDTFVSLQYT